MATFYDEGIYVCEVTGQAMGESSRGKPQFVLRFKVLGTPGDAGTYNPVARQYERSHYRSITDKTIAYFIEDLKELGYRYPTFKYLDPRVPGFQDFTGGIVEMRCSHRPDQNGEIREQWGISLKAAPAAVKPIDGKKLRELDSIFGKQLKEAATAAPTPARASSAAPPTPEPPAPSNVEITDDDIPF